MGADESGDEGSYIEFDDMPIYAKVPMWILLAKIPPQAKIAWIFLFEHANIASQMNQKKAVAPKMDTIAHAIGTTRQRLRKFLDELVDIGALEIREYRYAGGMRRGYAYKILHKLPAKHDGPASLGEYYKGVGGDGFEWVLHRRAGAEEVISAGQAGRYPMATAGRSPKETVGRDPKETVDGDPKHPAVRTARRTKPLVAGKSKTPPPPSSVGAGEGATAEPPLEDEEMKSYDEDPSPEARAHYEGEIEEETAENEPDGLQEGLEGVRGLIASLPGLEGAQEGSCGFLEYPVAEALAAGWTETALRAALIRHTDVAQARNKAVIPSWYANAFSKIGPAPKTATPLCAHPGHRLAPTPDPVNGGCLPCNTVAARGPAADKPAERGPVPDGGGDALTMEQAMASMRRTVHTRGSFREDTGSRRQMPHHRAKDAADQACEQANSMLREG